MFRGETNCANCNLTFHAEDLYLPALYVRERSLFLEICIISIIVVELTRLPVGMTWCVFEECPKNYETVPDIFCTSVVYIQHKTSLRRIHFLTLISLRPYSYHTSQSCILACLITCVLPPVFQQRNLFGKLATPSTGIKTSVLHIGQGTLTPGCSSFHNWSRHSKQNVWMHGSTLGSTIVSVHMGHSVTSPTVSRKIFEDAMLI